MQSAVEKNTKKSWQAFKVKYISFKCVNIVLENVRGMRTKYMFVYEYYPTQSYLFNTSYAAVRHWNASLI